MSPSLAEPIVTVRSQTIEIALCPAYDCRSFRSHCHVCALIGDLTALNEAIHRRLVPCAAELDDDVLDERRKPRITDQRESKPMGLFIAVAAFTKRHERLRFEGVEDSDDWSMGTAGRAAVA